VGATVGCLVIVWLLALPEPLYPEPFNIVWFLLLGSSLLQTSFEGLLLLDTSMLYLVTWLVTGIAVAPFSRSNWNALRTAMWVGLFLALFRTASILIIDPSFWSSPIRNMSLISLFAACLITAPLSLASCIPIRMSAAWLLSSKAIPPEKIETVCECGAVFKSRPLLCSECGRSLAAPDAVQTT